MSTYIPKRKGENGEMEEIKFPWDVIADPPTIPDVSGKANLDGGNTWYGTQNFEDDVELYDLYAQGTIYTGTGGITVDDSQSQFGIFYAGDGGVKIGRQGNTNCPVELLDSAGTSGQVMTSQGDGKTPMWVSPAIKSATLSGTTLTIVL